MQDLSRPACRRHVAEPTFACLKVECAKAPNQTKRSVANNLAVLRQFMSARGLTDGSPISPTMTVSFEQELRIFETEVQKDTGEKAALSRGSVASYRSRLRLLSGTAIALAGRHVGTEGFGPVLAAAVDEFVRLNVGNSIRGLAGMIGVRGETLAAWLGGRLPRPIKANWDALTRAEQLLDVRPGLLTALVFTEGQILSVVSGNAENKTRNIKKLIRSVNYRPKELPPGVAPFLVEYERFKTGLHPGDDLMGEPLQRAANATWRELKGMATTGIIFKNSVLRMCGFLLLPSTVEQARAYLADTQLNLRRHGVRMTERELDELAPYFVGKGMKTEEITVAHLIQPKVVDEFIKFNCQRSRGGKPSGFDRRYLSAVAMPLVRAEFGFLTQRVDMSWDILKWPRIDLAAPDAEHLYEQQKSRWAAQCSRWYGSLRSMAGGIRNGHKEIDPHVHLKPILDLDGPLDAVHAIIAAHLDKQPQGTLDRENGSIALARWHRDQLLLRMISLNPLRNRNFREQTWRQDNSGNLYKNGQRWSFRFKPEDFKNQKGAASQPYNVELAAELFPWIERYLFEARPLLLRAAHRDEVFITSAARPFSAVDLSRLIFRLTRKYMPTFVKGPGFRTQAFRHIIATAWLRANPGDYLTVADILHDKIETVLANYHRKSPADGLKRFYAWSERTRPGL